MTVASVTGGTGFIGRRLVTRLLKEGIHVRLLTREPEKLQKFWQSKKLDPWKGDLNTPETLQGFLRGAINIYHLAGEIRDPNKMQSTHVEGTRCLCEAAAEELKHWIQLSSVGVYGHVRQGIVTEDNRLDPKGVYETTKAESDRLVIQAAERGNFTFSILRPSVVYGPDMPSQSLFQLISMIAKGVFFFIGKEGASVNYIHVDNVIEGLMRCAENPAAKGKIYNLSDNCTLEYLVAIIAKELEKPPPNLRLPETPIRWLTKLFSRFKNFPLTESRIDALTNRSEYSIARVRKEIGYVHKISMDEGIREMVKVWKQCFGHNE
jgi:nucleoside-diphosphate-sugar epimerase